MPVVRTDKQNLNTRQVGSSRKAGADPKDVGQGWLTYFGSLPPADPKTREYKKSGNSSAVDSLAAFMLPGGGSGDTDVMLAQVAEMIDRVVQATQKNQIKSDQQTAEAKQKAQEAKLKEAEAKLQEAKKKEHTANILSALKCAFAWVAFVVSVAVAAVAIATGAGAIVGALLIAASVAALALAVDSTVDVATHKGGVAGNIARECGASDSEAGKADMGFRIGVSVLGALFSLGAGAAGLLSAGKAALEAGFGALEIGEETGGNGLETGGEVGLTVTNTSEDTGTTGAGAGEGANVSVKEIISVMKEAFMASLLESSGNIGQTAKLARQATAATNSVNSAGSSAVDVGKSVVTSQAEEIRADAKKREAEGKEFQAQLQMLDAVIDKAISLLVDEGNRFAAVLGSVVDAMNDRSQSLSQVRFEG